MAAIDFPSSPSLNQIHTEAGLTWIWTGEKWTSDGTQPGYEDLYVNKSGDNMTGSLTLGGDNITLGASTGTGTFKGLVYGGANETDNSSALAGVNQSSTNPTLFLRNSFASPSDALVIQAKYGVADNDGLNMFADGTIKIGGTFPSSPNIELSASGSATFAGTIAANAYTAGNVPSGDFAAFYGTSLGFHQGNKLTAYINGSTGNIDHTSSNKGPLAGFRNLIINGDLNVWQRNRTGVPVPIGTQETFYGPDRFRFQGITTGTANVSRAISNTGVHVLKIEVANTTNRIAFQQLIEAHDLIRDQEYTFSFYTTAAAPAAVVTSYDSNDTPKSISPGPNGWEATSLGNNRWAITFTYTTSNGSMNAPTERGLNCYIGCNGLTYPSNGTYDFWNIQLEPGAIATPFEHRPIAAELLMCQRYYRGDHPQYFPGVAGTKTVSERAISPPMRATPTVNVLGNNQGTIEQIGARNTGEMTTFYMTYTPGTGSTGADSAVVSCTLDAEL